MNTCKILINRGLTGLLMFSLLVPAFGSLADDSDNLQNQLSDVQSQMNQQLQKKNNADTAIGNIFEKLRIIQTNLDTARNEYKNISDQLLQTENKISETQVNLDKTQENLKKRQKILGNRIRDIYMHGQLDYLDVVIGAKDFNDFANRVELLERIVNSDMELIHSIAADRDTINQQKTELETERQEQVKLQADAAKKKEEIEKHKAEQQAVLDKTQNDKAAAEQAYNELEASSQHISDMLKARANAAAAANTDSDTSAPAPSGSGIFIWPVNGPITSPFGYRIHPVLGRRIFHSGIDIGVDYGTPVHAAAAGVVVEADWMGGYGNAVLIDHGNGLSTIYGHNTSLTVSAGQTVSQGQLIAYSGATGMATGPHVHFEVRLNGTPVNPMNYL